MSLLTDSDIEELYFTEVDNRIMSFAHAIEAAVIAKLAAVGVQPVAYEYIPHNELLWPDECEFVNRANYAPLYSAEAIAAAKVQALNRNLLT